MNNFQCETKALQNLFNSSRRRETLDKTISTKDWDEVCSWQKVIPMCRYVQKSRLKGKNKKAANKFKNLSISSNGNNNHDKLVNNQRANLQSCATAVSKEVFSNKQVKFKNFELSHMKEISCNNYSNKTGNVHNKYLRSTNVLSYDVPSWRFLVDTKRFDYIERCPPADKVYNLPSQCMSSQQNTTTSKIIDPAGFLDERIAHAYKSYQTFQPNLHVVEMFRRLSVIPISGNTHEVHDRLYYKCVINNLKNMNIIDEGESDGNEKTHTTSKVIKNVSKKKKEKKEHKLMHTRSNKNKASRFAQVSKQSSKDRHPSRSIETIDVSGDSPVLLNSTIQNTATSEELYLPLLNHSNYNSKIQYIKRAEVKLPPVTGIKMCPTSVSNTSLVL